MFDKESVSRKVGKLRGLTSKEVISLKSGELFVEGKQGEPYVFGTFFGEKNHYYKIETPFTIPVDWASDRVELRITSNKNEWDNSTNPQIKVLIDGVFIQAVDVNHTEVVLPEWVIQAGTCSLVIDIFSGRDEKQFPINVSLHRVDEKIRKLGMDFAVALDAWRTVEEDDTLNLIYRDAMKKAVHHIDFLAPYSTEFYASMTQAEKILKDKLYDSSVARHPGVVKAVGHTHIDIAWLWTVQQAIEKGERSFTTVLKLMEEYDDYTFIQSQPQMYQYLKEDYPELYASIKEKIKEGRWEVDGGMWVEADCNLTAGESLARQFLYGKRFIKEEFNKDSRILWLPDVFGYTAALPQLMKKSGIDYFMTTKLSWNQFNQIPNDSFYWKGIDGTEILTHLITTVSEGYSPTPFYTTYNGMLDAYTVRKSWDRYLQKDVNDEILIAYGYGDGGGGPTRNMIETGQRLKNGLPGIPKVDMGTSLDFFENLEKNSEKEGERFPTWMGELYFEYHRGTYTSIGKNKKFNRQSEALLQGIEKLFVHYGQEKYPRETLKRLWELVLLNQFHDILPGSSIKEVYDQTDEEYELIFTEGYRLIEELFTKETSTHFMVYNPISVTRDIHITLPLDSNQVAVLDGKKLASQRTSQGDTVIRIPNVPGLGGQCINIVTQETLTASPLTQTVSKKIETPFYVITFDEHYQIRSLWDKEEMREVVVDGKVLNQLVVYEDLPMHFDAWDIDIYYKDKSWQVTDVQTVELVEQGAIRESIKIVRRFNQSTITQWIHLSQTSKRIDFETTVDWHEQHMLLKAQFPVDVNTLKATFDIQFGNVERPIHQNTSWDKARFEVSGQKWIDLSEGSYGVSLLTDSKYGYNVEYQNMGVTLIKSATDPHPEADQGLHEFTYAILPHQGAWQDSNVVNEALDLNNPGLMIPIPEGESFVSESLFTVDQPNVVIDTVKLAEDDDTVILRLNEFHNKRTRTMLTSSRPIQKVEGCNLLEDVECVIEHEGQTIPLTLLPYDIQTIKITFGKDV